MLRYFADDTQHFVEKAPTNITSRGMKNLISCVFFPVFTNLNTTGLCVFTRFALGLCPTGQFSCQIWRNPFCQPAVVHSRPLHRHQTVPEGQDQEEGSWNHSHFVPMKDVEEEITSMFLSNVCTDLHAREQLEQPPPAHPPGDFALGARWDDAAVRYGHMGTYAAGPRLRRRDRLLPRVLHLVGTRPGARPGEKHVPKNYEEVSVSLLPRQDYY